MGANPQLSSQSETDNELSTFRRALPQFIAVGVKNIVLFGYGMTLGFPTIVIPAIQGGDGREQDDNNAFSLTQEQISWLSSINLLCVPLGCFFSGFLTEPTGKRRAMQLVNIPMFLSWLLFYFSTNVNYLYAGLCLSGLSGGLMEAPVLTYVAEVTQPQFRGMLAATGTTCVITGIFVQFVLGKFFTWRLVALICSCLPLLTIITLFFVPESPYWLLTKGRINEARNSLCWLRGWVPFAKVEEEFNQIYDVLSVRRREAEEAKLLPFHKRIEPFTKRGFIAPFMLVAATFFIGHFSGKTPLQTFAVQIFNTLKAPIDKYYATILLGAAELIGAFSCVLLVHITGKRPLVFVSLVGTGICFGGAATYAWYLDEVPGVIVDNIVANHSSLPGFITRSELVNQDNITAALEFSQSNNHIYETTTELDDFISTTLNESYDSEAEYADQNSDESSENGTATKAVEATTIRSKRMNVIKARPQDTSVNHTELNEIILQLPNAEENKYLWLPLSLLLTGSLFAHIGIRIIPWILIGEVFPVNVRSVASGLSSGTGYLFAFLSNKLFLSMLSTLTLPGTFWFYSGVALIGCVILYHVLPETEGRTLTDIEDHFLGKRSLSDQRKIDSNNCTNNNNSSNGNHNNPSSELNMVAVVSQLVSEMDRKLNENNLFEQNNVQSHRLSVPDLFINRERSPNAGSKRYKHRISDSIRSRNSTNSNDDDDVQDTRL